MSRSQSAWSDFETAWKSVEELKEELLRTEAKLQNAAKSYVYKSKPKKEKTTQPQMGLSSHRGSDVGSRAKRKRKVSRRQDIVDFQYPVREVPSKVPEAAPIYLSPEHKSLLLDENPKQNHILPTHRNVSDQDVKYLRSVLGKVIVDAVVEGLNSASLPVRDLLSSHANGLATRMEQPPQASPEPAHAGPSSGGDGKSSPKKKVTFSEWEKDYLNEVLPEFRISPSDVREESGDTSFNTDDLRRRLETLKTGHKPLSIPVESTKLEGYKKLTEIVEKQREIEELSTADIADGDFFGHNVNMYRQSTDQLAGGGEMAVSGSLHSNASKSSGISRKMTRKVAKLSTATRPRCFLPTKSLLDDFLEMDLALRKDTKDNVSPPSVKVMTKRRSRKFHKVKSATRSTHAAKDKKSPPKMSISPVPPLHEGKEELVEDTPQDKAREEVAASASESQDHNGERYEQKGSVDGTIDLTESPKQPAENEEKELKDLRRESPEEQDYLTAARQLLEELSDTASDESFQTENGEVIEINVQLPGLSSAKKRKATKPLMQQSPAAKVRHYDREKIKQYIEKQKALRRKRQIEEKKRKKQAQEKKMERLRQLYEFQKQAAKNSIKGSSVHSTKPSARNVFRKKSVSEVDNQISITSLNVEVSESQQNLTQKTSDSDIQIGKNFDPQGRYTKPFMRDDKLPGKSASPQKRHVKPSMTRWDDKPLSAAKPISKLPTALTSENGDIRSLPVRKARAESLTKSREQTKSKESKSRETDDAPSLPVTQTKTESFKKLREQAKQKVSESKETNTPQSRESNSPSKSQGSHHHQSQEKSQSHSLRDKHKRSKEVKESSVTPSSRRQSEDDSLSGIPSINTSDGHLDYKENDSSTEYLSLQSSSPPTSKSASILHQIKSMYERKRGGLFQDIIKLQRAAAVKEQNRLSPSPAVSHDEGTDRSIKSVDKDPKSANEQVPEDRKTRIAMLMDAYAAKTADFFGRNEGVTEKASVENQKSDKIVPRADEWIFSPFESKPDPFNFINTWKRKPLVIPRPSDSSEFFTDESVNPTPLSKSSAMNHQSPEEKSSYTTEFPSEDASEASEHEESSVEQGTIKSLVALQKPTESSESSKRSNLSIKEAIATDDANQSQSTSSGSEIFGDGNSHEHTLTPEKPFSNSDDSASSVKTAIAEDSDVVEDIVEDVKNDSEHSSIIMEKNGSLGSSDHETEHRSAKAVYSENRKSSSKESSKILNGSTNGIQSEFVNGSSRSFSSEIKNISPKEIYSEIKNRSKSIHSELENGSTGSFRSEIENETAKEIYSEIESRSGKSIQSEIENGSTKINRSESENGSSKILPKEVKKQSVIDAHREYKDLKESGSSTISEYIENGNTKDVELRGASHSTTIESAPKYTNTIAEFLENYNSLDMESKFYSRNDDILEESMEQSFKSNTSGKSVTQSTSSRKAESTRISVSHSSSKHQSISRTSHSGSSGHSREVQSSSGDHSKHSVRTVLKKHGDENLNSAISGMQIQVPTPMAVLDRDTLTKVISEVAGAAAKSAVTAAFECQSLLMQVPTAQNMSGGRTSSSSRKEYSSDFESDHASLKSSAASSKHSHSSKPANKSASSVVEEEVLSTLGSSSKDSIVEFAIGSVESSTPKKRYQSGNVSSPSPASLSDNISSVSSEISSIGSSASRPGKHRESHNQVSLPVESFAELTLGMVQKLTYEEELRARHQLNMLEFQEKTLVEKAKAELKFLERMKKELQEHNATDKLPKILKKQRELILQFRQERAQLRCMQETYRRVCSKHHSVSSGKQRLQVEQPVSSSLEIANRESSVISSEKMSVKTASPSVSLHSVYSAPAEEIQSTMKEEKASDIEELVMSSSSNETAAASGSQNTTVSKISQSSYSKHVRSYSGSSNTVKHHDSSHLSQLSSHSLELVLQSIKKLESNKRYLTKRQQRLVQRRNEVENLLKWKKKLDKEEREVKELEHKAVEVLEKSKLHSKYYVSSSPSSPKNGTESSKISPKQSISSTASGPQAHSETDGAISSQSVRTASESKDSDSVPEEDIHSRGFVSSGSVQEALSSARSSSVADVDEKLVESSSAHEDEKMSQVKTISKDTASSRSSGSTVIVELEDIDGRRKSSPSVKEKSPSSLGAYSDSFESANGSERDSGKDVIVTPKSLFPESSKRKMRIVTRSPRRHDSSGSDDSFTISHSETASDQSDLEGRIYALTEELRRRKDEAEKLRKEQKRRHSDRLREQEISMKKQLEAYDRYIVQASKDLEELDAVATADSTAKVIVSVKPQIKQPHVAKSKQLQKQSSVLQESERSDDRNDSSSSEGKDITFKERKPHTSYLAKKLRAIGSKDILDDASKEFSSISLPSASSLPPIPEPKENSSLQSEENSSQIVSTEFEPSKVSVSPAESIASKDQSVPDLDFTSNGSSYAAAAAVVEYSDKVSAATEKESAIEYQSSEKSSIEEFLDEGSGEFQSTGSFEGSLPDQSRQEKSDYESRTPRKLSEESHQSNKSDDADQTGENSDQFESFVDRPDLSLPDMPSLGKVLDSTGYISSSSGSSGCSGRSRVDSNNKTTQNGSHSVENDSFESASSVEEDIKSLGSGGCSGSNGCSRSASEDESVIHCGPNDVQLGGIAGESVVVEKGRISPDDRNLLLSEEVQGDFSALEGSSVIEHKDTESSNVDKIADDLFKSLQEDTVSSVSSILHDIGIHETIPKQLMSAADDNDEKVSKHKLYKSSLTDVHQKTALSVSENVVDSLLGDSIQTMVNIYKGLTEGNTQKDDSQNSANDASKIESFSGGEGHDDNGKSYSSDDLVPAATPSFDYEYEPSSVKSNIPEDSQLAALDAMAASDFDGSWYDDLSLTKNSSPVESVDAQLLVRQYPYYYRQIPNKPPPPYTPPSTPLPVLKVEKPEPISIPGNVYSRLEEIVEECLTAIFEAKEQDVPVLNAKPPNKFTSTDDLDLVTRSEKIFESFIFELVKENVLKIYSEVEEKPKPWLRNQKLTRKPLLPKNKTMTLSAILNEVKKLLKVGESKDGKRKQTTLSIMKLGRKKRDFVDTIIIEELKEEEPEWVNYDQDEFNVKCQLSDSIMHMLINDTVKNVHELDSALTSPTS